MEKEKVDTELSVKDVLAAARRRSQSGAMNSVNVKLNHVEQLKALQANWDANHRVVLRVAKQMRSLGNACNLKMSDDDLLARVGSEPMFAELLGLYQKVDSMAMDLIRPLAAELDGNAPSKSVDSERDQLINQLAAAVAAEDKTEVKRLQKALINTVKQ